MPIIKYIKKLFGYRDEIEKIDPVPDIKPVDTDNKVIKGVRIKNIKINNKNE